MPCSFEKPVTRIYKLLSLEQGVIAAGTAATPAAFYLGLCRLRGTLSLPAPHDCAAGGLFSFAATKNRIGRRSRCRYDHCRRNCSSLPQRRLESDAEVVVAEPQLSCSDSQIDPLKSRITVAAGSFPDKTLHRFPSLGMKSRIDARKRA